MPDSNATNLMSLPTESLRKKFEEISNQAEKDFHKRQRILLEAFSDVVKKLQDIDLPVILYTTYFRTNTCLMTIGNINYDMDINVDYIICKSSHASAYALTTVLHFSSLDQDKEKLLENLIKIVAHYEIDQKAMDDFAVPAKPKPLDDRRKVSLNKPKAS